MDYGFNEFLSGIGAIIQGRRAYEVEVKHGWETPTPVPTFVLSHHLPERKPQRGNVVFTDEDISEVLKKAKQLTSKDVWIEGLFYGRKRPLVPRSLRIPWNSFLQVAYLFQDALARFSRKNGDERRGLP